MKIIVNILLLFCSLLIYAQSYENRNAFIDEVTKLYSSGCRDCYLCDYLIAFRLERNGIVSDYLIYEDNLREMLVTKYHIGFDSAGTVIRKKLIGNETINVQSSNNYEIFDIWEGDDTFHKLKEDKEKFLDYYFNADSSYKYEIDDYVENNDGATLHNKIFKITAIVKQLYEWNIPVYGCNYGGGIKYGKMEEWVKGNRIDGQ